MGGCASKPKDLDTTANEAPAPVEAPAVPHTPVAEAETAAPEEVKEDGAETKKEEPLVDSSEPVPAKAEEAKEEAEAETSEAKAKPVEEAGEKEVA